MRRLLAASTKVTALHHHIRVSAAMRADFDWWLAFAAKWNGKSFFLEHAWIVSPSFQLFTDASHQGYGCYWQGRWLAGSSSRRQLMHDIQWKELFAVVVAAKAWGSQLHSKRLCVHCDNQAVVDVWRKGTSKQPALMQLSLL